MLKSLFWLIAKQLWPRATEELRASETWIAVALGVAAAVWLPALARGPVGTTLLMLGLYGIVLLVVIAGTGAFASSFDRELVARLFSSRLPKCSPDQPERNAFTDFTFIFAWAAFAHWVLVVHVLGVSMFADTDASLGDATSIRERILIGVTATIATYAIQLCFITIATVAMLARVYAVHAKRKRYE